MTVYSVPFLCSVRLAWSQLCCLRFACSRLACFWQLAAALHKHNCVSGPRIAFSFCSSFRKVPRNVAELKYAREKEEEAKGEHDVTLCPRSFGRATDERISQAWWNG